MSEHSRWEDDRPPRRRRPDPRSNRNPEDWEEWDEDDLDLGDDWDEDLSGSDDDSEE